MANRPIVIASIMGLCKKKPLSNSTSGIVTSVFPISLK